MATVPATKDFWIEGDLVDPVPVTTSLEIDGVLQPSLTAAIVGPVVRYTVPGGTVAPGDHTAVITGFNAFGDPTPSDPGQGTVAAVAGKILNVRFVVTGTIETT